MEEKTITPEEEVNTLVANAKQALNEFMSLNQEQIDFIVAKASVAALDQHGVLAMHAYNETHRGRFEDKATKNLFACEHVVNNMRHLKTVGVIDEDPITGITKIAEPVGIVAGLTPTTNPTSTAIFKALICLKTRNPIIFAFHPSAQQSSAHAARVVYEAAVKAGAPKNCVQWIEHPSMDATNLLMNHKDVATILATGGNAMVRAAYSCGKPALGVGAGNVPSYIEKTANIKRAVHDIILSKSFDNGMICASEQAVIIDEEIYEPTMARFQEFGAYVVNKKEKQMLEAYMFNCPSKKDYPNAKLNAKIVGMPATKIAHDAGFDVPENIEVLLVECSEVGVNEPLTREKLSPVLAVLKSKDYHEGIDLARQMVEFNGLGHSAAIHTANEDIVKEFGDKVNAIRIIWNSPSTFGGIGNVYNSFLPSLTLGCGSYGGNSTDDNVSAVNLINVKKIGKRRNNMQWFKVPSKIYFERNSIEYLRSCRDIEKVFIVTDRVMVDLGFVDKVTRMLNERRNKVQIQLFCDVLPDPTLSVVKKGYELMKTFEPDSIIALGGGSAMDAAKGMWLFYEHPDVEFDDLKQKFMDIRKRAFKYPELGRKAKLICIPTTSGTGSEVTPFAVITDDEANKKYPLADYSLTPTVAIIDPEFVDNLPKRVVANTGMDVLTHAIEAYVSVLSNDYTDALCVAAVKIVFEYLERSYKNGAADSEAKEKMHNASAMAGMAFGNAFLGLNHSLAHKIGGEFHVAHGLANSILLPYVIRYNGQKPTKMALWPKYEYYNADLKYCELARQIGLKFDTVEEGVNAFAEAVASLAERLEEPMCFKDCGLDEETWMNARNKVALLAYEDQCSPANPRLPLIDDMEEILTKAYYPYEHVEFKASKKTK